MANTREVFDSLFLQLKNIIHDFDTLELPYLTAKLQTIAQIMTQLQKRMTSLEASTTYLEDLTNLRMILTQMRDRCEARKYKEMKWYEKVWYYVKKLLSLAGPLIKIAGLLPA
jgi:hypothetical protein